MPNAIGFLRGGLIVLFLVIAFVEGGHDGVAAGAAAAFFVAGAADWLDGLAARVTGQYSRLGALLDPLLDRLLLIAGAVVCWRFGLLPRWALALLFAREIAMLALSRAALARHVELRINWPGRLAVGPTMLGVFLGLIGVRLAGEATLYAGLALALYASALYVMRGVSVLRSRKPSTSG